MTRLEAARAWGRPVGTFAIIAAMLALVTAIIVAVLHLDKDPIQIVAALTAVCGLFGFIYRQRGVERSVQTETERTDP